MNGVILAAGRGRRLGETIAGKPKCLIELGGQSILAHQLYALEKSGIDNFTIVIGYEADMVANEAQRLVGDRASFVYNPKFDETNTSYSLYLVTCQLQESFYYLNGDVLFSSDLISRLNACPSPSVLALDAKACGDEEVKVVVMRNRAVEISKEIPAEMAAGEFIGVARFNASLVQALHRSLEWLMNVKHDYMAYFEKGLEMVLDKQFVAVVDVSDLPTVEIDFPEDLRYAREVVLPEIMQLELV
ncbi:phosphocholine cytidylyltransferase family protein [bacterium]|nr:phosphocholine cytidylyltransferase family protein [bacterium]